MIRSMTLVIMIFVAHSAWAESLTTVRAIRPHVILGAEDLAVLDQVIPGAFRNATEIVGQETKITLYPGRPIRPSDIGAPALVERNQFVELIYSRGGLVITTEGRALGRGAAGERIRVMNVSSRTTVSGHVTKDGAILVSPSFNNRGG